MSISRNELTTDWEHIARLESRLSELERIVTNQYAALSILADRYNWRWHRGSFSWEPQHEEHGNPLEIATRALAEGKA